MSQRLYGIFDKLIKASKKLTLKYIINDIDKCEHFVIHNSHQLGHPITCNLEHYGSTDQLFLRNISPNYLFIRGILQLIHEVKNANFQINLIINAVRTYVS